MPLYSSADLPEPTDLARLLRIGSLTIGGMPNELRFDSFGEEFEPFALVRAADDEVLFVDAPFLCASVGELRTKAWEDLTGKVKRAQAKSALLVLPLWWAPSPEPRPGLHPQRSEEVGVKPKFCCGLKVHPRPP